MPAPVNLSGTQLRYHRDANVPVSGVATIVDDAEIDIATMSRCPGERGAGWARADIGAIGKPIEGSDAGSRGCAQLQGFVAEIGGMQLVGRPGAGIGDRGRDMFRGQRIAAATIRWNRSARHTGERIEPQNVGWPRFEHLRTSVARRRVSAGAQARPAIDQDAAMDAADSNRRFTRNKPGTAAMRPLRIGKIA